MIINKRIQKIVLLWAPIIILILSIYFLIKDEFIFIFGLLALGIALDSFIDLRVKGLDNEDERYLLIKSKGNEFAHLTTYSVIIILIIIHFFFAALETDFILIFLLLTIYISSAIGTLYLSLKY
ncbi:hypothetical protein BTS2_3721 [Bacillus sp. TS-2]|nr:hypothetical protein BTS2_3721 [Bacillus sp. TS-2]